MASAAEPTRVGTAGLHHELEAAHEELVASDAPSPLDDLLALWKPGARQALLSLPEDFAEAWSFTTSRV